MWPQEVSACICLILLQPFHQPPACQQAPQLRELQPHTETQDQGWNKQKTAFYNMMHPTQTAFNFLGMFDQSFGFFNMPIQAV